MAEAADFQGMTPSPARRWLRRTAASLVGLPLLAGLLAQPAGAAAEVASGQPAAVKAEPTGPETVSVAINSFEPQIPSESDTLTITGKLENNSAQTVTDASLALRLGQSLSSRTQIDSAAKNGGTVTGAEGLVVGGDEYLQKFKKIAPHGTQDFRLSIPVKELDLDGEGVYQLGVALTGRTESQFNQILGIERTFLPWQPDGADTQTKVSYMWPLISRTHLTAESASDANQTPVFKDESLIKEIAPGGRLERMVSEGSTLPVTWVIDPDLVASAALMAQPYNVQGPDDTVVAGDEDNQKIARNWLNSLIKAVQDEKVVALPFADPDLASMAHGGGTESLGHLKDATEAAVKTLETLLHIKPNTDFAWPAEGAVDPKIVNTATSAGASNVIARNDSFQETGNLPYTPSAARPIGDGTTAVVADSRLSKAFQGDMTSAEKSTLATQQFLAQSLMINLQDPEKQRSIVVAPQRMPTTAQAMTMATAIRAQDAGGWSQSENLISAAKEKPDPGATTEVPSADAYPAALRKQEMPLSGFDEIRKIQSQLNDFKVILTRPERVVVPFGRAIDRALSTSWRGLPEEAHTYRKSVLKYLDDLTGGVALIKKSEAKLSGRSATIPVTVQNNLAQGVENLRVRLTSTKPNRLKINGERYAEQEVEVAGGHAQSLKFSTTANASGPVDVVAQLVTADGKEYGDPVPFTVKVTEVPATVLAVIAGGFLLLVLAGFRMYQRRKRIVARRAEEQDGGSSDGPDDGTDNGTDDGAGPDEGGPEPEQPSDPTPDTSTESTDPSGTGERVDR
ncbi:hypothetical protein G6045_09535 [Streptomyces sp. YC504]|uniref:Secreted protein n=1 Tax=Streptomyces mesophilus TaxID=1775132 RepID=A0A6G4XFF8_9ACTN|nr:DUF6049 family protein [Streptomyces mesophilus]NGO75912.1 hypothetical protein [Streptomyces mesophilus]